MACAEDRPDVAEESGEVTFNPKNRTGDLGFQRRNEEHFMTCGEDERRDMSPVGPRSFMQPLSRPLIMPDRYDGSSHWSDFRAHFESCAETNGWND